MNKEQTTRELLRACLQAVGITDEPETYGDGIHSWRCEHPDRYGRCNCFEEAVDYFYRAGLRANG